MFLFLCFLLCFFLCLFLSLCLRLTLRCTEFLRYLLRRFRRKFRRRSYRREPVTYRCRSQRKPSWVPIKIISLSAHLPSVGCRKIAALFNRLYAARGMTVSKSYVAKIMRKHHYDIAELRRKWKHHIPPQLPNNHTWGLDATGKTDLNGQLHPVLAMIDHGSRYAVYVKALPDLTTITILRSLLTAIEKFGKPRCIRTDNAPQFRSALFRFSLAALGIRQRFSLPYHPWQNGYVEKLFGTLKEKLNQLAVPDFNALQISLAEFGVWYNAIRPHNHLKGRTPFEAWNKIDPYRHAPKEVRYFSAWDGLLCGIALRY